MSSSMFASSNDKALLELDDIGEFSCGASLGALLLRKSTLLLQILKIKTS